MKRKQAGVSLIGVLIIGAILGFLFLMGMRTVPAVTEYFAVKKIINVIVDSGPGPDTTVSDLRKDFDKRAYIDQVEHVTGKDLEVLVEKGRQWLHGDSSYWDVHYAFFARSIGEVTVNTLDAEQLHLFRPEDISDLTNK